MIATRLQKLADLPIAIFVTRWILGLVFVMAGYWKIFEKGVVPLTQLLFVDRYQASWIPEWLLWTLGLCIPFVELAAGILLCLGLFGRHAAAVLGLLLVVTTYGHLLLEPLFDLSGLTFTRLALVILILLLPREADLLSVDHLLRIRSGRRSAP